MWQLADWPFGSDYGKSGMNTLWSLFPCGFPNAVVRHGCHCTLLFRCRQPSLGMDARCLVRLIHVNCAGGFISHAHDWQVFTAMLHTISCTQDSVYRAVPDIPKLSAGKGLSSLTMNSSTRHRHSSCEVFVGKWKQHHGRVGIAGLLCHHLIVPIGFKLDSSFWLHVWEFLMASRVRRPCVFLRLSLLECFTCLYLHPYWSASPGFWFLRCKGSERSWWQNTATLFRLLSSSRLPVFSDYSEKAGYSRRTHEIIWSYALHLSLLTAPENRKPRRRCFSRWRNKKSLHSRRRRKWKISPPPQDSG